MVRKRDRTAVVREVQENDSEPVIAARAVAARVGRGPLVDGLNPVTRDSVRAWVAAGQCRRTGTTRRRRPHHPAGLRKSHGSRLTSCPVGYLPRRLITKVWIPFANRHLAGTVLDRTTAERATESDLGFSALATKANVRPIAVLRVIADNVGDDVHAPRRFPHGHPTGRTFGGPVEHRQRAPVGARAHLVPWDGLRLLVSPGARRGTENHEQPGECRV